MHLPNYLISFLAMPLLAEARYLMYLTGQHQTVPPLSQVSEITHVAIAFMPSSLFNTPNATSFPLFTTVSEVRAKFKRGTKVMVAIGGWGDTKGFEEAAKSGEGRVRWAGNVGRMVESTGADGVDIDWEYPGGNGEDYKKIPNSSRAWEIDAYPKLLSSVRKALGPNKLISAAVPGLERDMLAFTSSTVPLIDRSLDFWNIMTYDLMNRRDDVTKHHTGIQASLRSVEAYMERGVKSRKMNLGFAFYVKWFRTTACGEKVVGCKTVLMEDPETGADLGQAGAFSWDDDVPKELEGSFGKALEGGMWDEDGGGWYYWDKEERIWWSWDTAEVIGRKFPEVVEQMGLGGVFAWGLGEDGPRWERLDALTERYRKWKGGVDERVKDEL